MDLFLIYLIIHKLYNILLPDMDVNMHLAENAGSSGTYKMTGGVLDINGNILGGLGASTLIIDGGTATVSGSITVDGFYLGKESGTNVSHTMGVGSGIDVEYEDIGQSGTAIPAS